MRIEHGNSWCHVTEHTDEELEWLDGYISVPVQNYFQGVGYVDDRYRMLSAVGHRFAAGLLPLVQRAKVCSVLLDDLRGPAPCTLDANADLAWLRGYQRPPVSAASSQERGIIQAPTGSGKSELMIAMTRTLPCEWLMVVHRSDLVSQMADRYSLRTGERAGTFESGEWKPGSCNLTVATFQAVYHALKSKTAATKRFLEAIQGLFVDEVHAAPASSYYRVIQAFQRARYKVGLSGTPLHRGDVSSLQTMGALGPIVHHIKYQTLVDAGVLARPVVRMVDFEHSIGDWDRGDNWRAVYSGLIVSSQERNRLIVEMADVCQKPCLLFVEEMEQMNQLLPELRMSGLRAEGAHGGHWKADRKRMLEELAGGDLDVLVCSVIFQEGIDVPELRGVINAGGKMSTVACLQRVGRGMRKVPGKDTFEVWDVADRGQPWLANHARERLYAYRGEGFDVEIVDDLCQGRLF